MTGLFYLNFIISIIVYITIFTKKIKTMKKIFTLTIALSLFLISCTSNESEVSSEVGLLCVQKVQKNSSGTTIRETNFNYNGNKIVNAITNFNNSIIENKYYYTEDLITKIDSYENNILLITHNFTYNSQQNLIQHVLIDHLNNEGSKFVYNYINDMSITEYIYEGDLLNQNQLTQTASILLTKTNGEITTFRHQVNGSSYSSVSNFFYDSKNNYMKNVLGYGKLTLLAGTNYSWETYKHDSNYCSQNVTQLQSSTISGNQRNINSLYTYNSNNYPISETETHTLGATSYTNNYWYYYN